MQEFSTKSTGSSYTAVEFNQHIEELENIIKSTGIALSSGDLYQVSKAVANYVAGGDYYADSGIADAYVLTPVGLKKAPAAVLDGMRVRFKVGNTNTGASTVNVNGIGAVAIKGLDNVALVAGELILNDIVELEYNSTLGGFIIMNTAKRTIKKLLQNFTVIGDIGDVAQQNAGHIFELTEPGSDTSDVIAQYNFLNGALTTDEKGVYALTNHNSVLGVNGITGNDYAVEFNGTNKGFSQGTLLDVVPTAIAIDTWLNLDVVSGDDYIFEKQNSAGDFLFVKAKSGFIRINANTGNQMDTPNISASEWFLLTINWDTTNGLRAWINDALVVQRADFTTLMSNGTSKDFYIGNESTLTTYGMDGKMCMFRVRDKVLTQKDIDIAYATKYTIPSLITGTDYTLQALLKENGNDDFISEDKSNIEISRDGTNNLLYRYGGLYDSADKLRLKIRN